MSNTLLESLWARVDTNIGSRIKQISELLTQALSANTESTTARDIAVAAEKKASTAATNAASSESVAKSAETAASGHAQVAQTSATEAVDAKNRAVEIVGGDFATLDYVDQRVPIRGTGSPEGSVTAPVGTIYTDTAATNGAIRWIKTSGTGNTGWRVEYGDTGWRARDADFLATGSFMIRRINNNVYLKIGTGQFGLFTFRETSPAAEVILPLHFRPSGNEFMDVRYDNTKAVVGTVSIQYNGWLSPRMDAGYTDTSRNLQTSVTVYPTDHAWPSSLPGTPA